MLQPIPRVPWTARRASILLEHIVGQTLMIAAVLAFEINSLTSRLLSRVVCAHPWAERPTEISSYFFRASIVSAFRILVFSQRVPLIFTRCPAKGPGCSGR